MEKNNKKEFHSKGKRYASVLFLYVLCILSIGILGFNSFITSPIKEAWALQQFETSTSIQNGFISKAQTGNSVYLVNLGTKSGNPWVEFYNATTGVFINSFNLTSASSAGATPNGLSCSFIDAICIVSLTGGTGGLDRIFAIDVKNGIVPTSASTGASYTRFKLGMGTYFDQSAGLNQVFAVQHGGAHVTIDNFNIPQVGGRDSINALFTSQYTYDTGLSNTISPSKLVLGFFNTTNSIASIKPYLAFSSATNNLVQIVDINNRANICQYAPAGGTSTTDLVYFNDTSVGLNGANGLGWLVSGSTTTFYKIDNSCNTKITYSVSSMIQTAYPVRSLDFSNNRHEIYFYAGTTKNSLVVVNSTKTGASADSTFVNNIFQMSQDNAGSQHYSNIMSSSTSNGMVGVLEATNIFFLYWTARGTPTNSGSSTNFCYDQAPVGGTPNLVCFPCPPPPGSNYVCDANGFPQGAPFLKGITGSGFFYNGTQSAQVIACATGWFSCTNQNIVTNGVGYMILIILIISSAIVIMYATYKTDHKPMEATFVIVLVSTLECGALWRMNIVDFTPFAIAILGVIGLSGFSIYRKVSDGD